MSKLATVNVGKRNVPISYRAFVNLNLQNNPAFRAKTF